MNNFQILVVEDDAPVRNLITTTLRAHDYRFIASGTGEGAVMEVASHNPDIILLDLGLPDIDGVEVIRRVRSWSNVPIIVISARAEDNDKIDALDAGADDYLTKPFLMQELVLRIQHLLQRTYRAELRENMSDSIQIGSRSILLSDALIQLPDGSTLSLTATERTILQKLIENRGHIVTYDALCEAVWGDGYYGYENSLNVHIRHLREKIGENAGKPQYLITMRGIGYKLTEAR